MKKVMVPVVVTLLILLVLVQTGSLQMFGINKASFVTEKENTSSSSSKTDKVEAVTENGVSYKVKAEGNYFYIYGNERWDKTFWKGVNIGSGSPGLFPGELNISYETYSRWFEEIAAMNANCIRVYTAMMPDFYDAFYDYNKNAEKPLYLFQGVWVDENDIEALNDVYAENNKILKQVKTDALNLVDIIHGKGSLPPRSGYASGIYKSDVSPWFAGWILGMEFDPKFIENTNNLHKAEATYDGEYLFTQGSTPFEAFLAQVGDAVIKSETENYNWQSPVAFSNWVTTDPLTHPQEPYVDEDSVTLNTESIKSRNTYKCNQFASYHVYPYYPDSMNLQEDYKSYKDESGKVNTYEAYLADLKLAHTMPIIIAEFGVSTSRGMAHRGLMNYNQGMMEETAAGEAVVDMFKSILKENYAGGIVFAWQDEWFKRTWNNEKFDNYERRPFWANAQTCEQCFGLLAFDPGAKEVGCVLDGETGEWSADDLVTENETGKLYMKADEAYVYFMIETAKGFDFKKDTLLIPIDTISGQGNKKDNSTGVSFTSEADFLISINGKENSRIFCDAYYDVFYYLYGHQYMMLKQHDEYTKKNSGIFNKMEMCIGYEMEVPTEESRKSQSDENTSNSNKVRGKIIPFQSYETGILAFGTSDTTSENFYSLSDFYEKDGIIEVRIPWQLLNFTDPSTKEIMADFYSQQSIVGTDFEKFGVGLGKAKSGSTIDMNNTFNYKEWKFTPTYHERLKKSYYILQDALKDLGV